MGIFDKPARMVNPNLTPEEKEKFESYFNSEYAWLLGDAPAVGRADVKLPPEVASTDRFYFNEIETAFGLLGALRARGIESVVGITVYQIDEVLPEELEYVNDPGCSYIILDKSRWVPDGPKYFLSTKELKQEPEFVRHMGKLIKRPIHQVPGYVDITIYADHKKLLSEYGSEYVWTISREEQREREERSRKFREALLSNDVGGVAAELKNVMFGLEIDGYELGKVDTRKLAEGLMGCIEVEEQDQE